MIRLFLRAAVFTLMGGLLAFPVAAQNFEPVVIVNDEIITNFDVAQRALLLRASGDRREADELREVALDNLIDDRLRVQAARQSGVTATPDDVSAGFRRLARQNRSNPDEMIEYFASRGVSSEALEYQVQAEVSWLRLVRRRFLPRVRITEKEVEDAIEALSGENEEVEYLLAEIRLPIDDNSEEEALAAARQVLRRVVSQGNFAGAAQQLSSGSTASAGGDLGWVGASALPPETLELISRMTADRVSRPIVEDDDVVIYGLRGIREAGAEEPVKYSLSQLVVGVAGNATQGIADAALARALAAKEQVTDCASIETLKSNFLPISGSIGELTFSQMPAPVRAAVQSLEIGDISDPIRSNDGFHIIVLCDKITPGSDIDIEAVARDSLIARKLDRYARGFIKELRREAVIETR